MTDNDSPDRLSWLDDEGGVAIDEYAQKLESYLQAMADGVVSDDELEAQEKRVVALMREIEPQLDDALHAKVTALLCELTAFDIMQLLHTVQAVAAQDEVPRLSTPTSKPRNPGPFRTSEDIMAGKPKSSFYVVLGLVVLASCCSRSGAAASLAPEGTGDGGRLHRPLARSAPAAARSRRRSWGSRPSRSTSSCPRRPCRR